MKHNRTVGVTAALAATALLAGCASSAQPKNANLATKVTYSTTTSPGQGAVGNITWNLQTEPNSLDPAHSGNYGPNQVIANLCDTLLRQSPANPASITPGLATTYSNPNATTWVYNLNPAAKFWDGSAVTPADVIFSLMRNKEPNLNSYYAQYFSDVTSIDQTGAHQITVHLKEPDAQFNEAMASPAGTVIEKAYAQAKGTQYGTATGGVMCSGPFEFSSWTPGKQLVIKKNPSYWDAALEPKAAQVTFTFIGDGATLANALLSGQVDGSYQLPWDALSKLSSSKVGNVYYGKSPIVFAVIFNTSSGPLADPKIRQALAYSLDRQGIIDNAFAGAASPVKALATAQTWSYAKDVYQAAWNKLPTTDQDLAKAKQLVKEAGSPKGQIVMAYASGASQYVATIFQSIQQTGGAIGLNIKLKPIPVQTYQNIYSDASVQKGIGGFETDWYPDLNDPLNWYSMFVKDASSLTFGYDNATVNSSIAQAMQTADPTQRAQLVVKAQSQVTSDEVWLPVAEEDNTLFMNKKITGAPASFVQLTYPWAALLGTR